ncbi:GNAT family N-acetyltransferase, partial [Microgenomates group bacterium]|nr:GNAT family N-acetyltransferase [Microgenomates group bacterium]
MVVAKEYQNRGLGTKLVQLSIENASKRKADILYGSTSNPKVKKMLTKLGFQRLTAPIYYKDITTKEIKREREFAYVFEFKQGLLENLNTLQRIYIGSGPI